MLDRVEHWRSAFASRGYGEGHRVGLLLQNRPVFVELWFALNALGVSVVPINPDLRMSELEYIIAHSEMNAAFVLAERRDEVETGGASGRPADSGRDGPGRRSRALRRCAAVDRGRRVDRMRAALYVRDDRAAQGLRAHQPLFPAFRKLVSRCRRPDRSQGRRRAHDHAAAAVSHECDGGVADGDAVGRRQPDHARSLPSAQLVGIRCATAAPPVCIISASCRRC